GGGAAGRERAARVGADSLPAPSRLRGAVPVAVRSGHPAALRRGSWRARANDRALVQTVAVAERGARGAPARGVVGPCGPHARLRAGGAGGGGRPAGAARPPVARAPAR